MVDREQGGLLVAYAVKASKNGKIAIIGDSTGYGQGGIKDAIEILALHNMKPVAVEKFGPKDTDMTSQLAKIRDSGADTVIIWAVADGTAQVLRSMDKIDYRPITLGTWGNLSSLLPNIAGARRWPSTSSSPRRPPRTAMREPKALAARVRKHFPTLTTFAASAQTYDAVMLLAAAIKQAGSTDGAKVPAALENVSGVQGDDQDCTTSRSARPTHEGLGVADFYLARWKGAKTSLRYEDAITKRLTAGRPEEIA